MSGQPAMRRRQDGAEKPSPKGPPRLDQIQDAQIQAADGVVLVDPNQPGWQQVVFSAEIKSSSPTSMLLQIIEIAVDARDEQQVRAARQRVRKLKSQNQSLNDTAKI